MSGTPEYYFKRRWMGLENLAQIVGDRNFSNKRNSVELSFGEELQDLVGVIESVLACTSEIREALFEKKLTAEAFQHDVYALEARVEQAVAMLNEGAQEILHMKNKTLVALANHQLNE